MAAQGEGVAARLGVNGYDATLSCRHTATMTNFGVAINIEGPQALIAIVIADDALTSHGPNPS